jgi:hypothetical protein
MQIKVQKRRGGNKLGIGKVFLLNPIKAGCRLNSKGISC